METINWILIYAFFVQPQRGWYSYGVTCLLRTCKRDCGFKRYRHLDFKDLCLRYTHQPSNDWFMKIEHKKYVNIKTIVNFLGNAVCLKLPHIHTITVCDTTSFFHGVWKVKCFKKIVTNQLYSNLLDFLQNLGQSSDISEELQGNVTKFIHQASYIGQIDEILVETRVLYKKMKTKSSLTLPPDPKSIKQHILRVKFQLFEWLQFNEKNQSQKRFIFKFKDGVRMKDTERLFLNGLKQWLNYLCNFLL